MHTSSLTVTARLTPGRGRERAPLGGARSRAGTERKARRPQRRSRSLASASTFLWRAQPTPQAHTAFIATLHAPTTNPVAPVSPEPPPQSPSPISPEPPHRRSPSHVRAGPEGAEHTFGRGKPRAGPEGPEHGGGGHQKQSYDIAGNLGDVELTLGKPRDAAEHLEYSYRNWPTGKQEARQRTLERLSQAKKLVGALEISVNVDGAEITVNDAAAGRAPLNHDVFVEAGAVSISVTAPGYATETKTVPVAKGESRKVAIELTADGSAGAATGGNGGNGGAGNNGYGGDSGAAGSGGTTVSTDGMSGKTVALIAGGALTVASAATWIGFYFAQKSTADDTSSLRDQIRSDLGPGACGRDPKAKLCVDLADKNDTGKTQKTLSTIGGIGFAAFGAATVAVWFLWPDEKKTSATTPHLAPSIAKDEIGVTVRGSF